MHQDKKDYFRLQIDHEITKIKKEIDELRELTKPISPENAIGRISRMDAINNKSINEAALRNKENKLIKLELAKSKIDNPEFGICMRCGSEIPEGRLLIMPESTKCVRCAN